MVSAQPSYKDLLDSATQRLYDESDSPRIDAEVLLQHLVGESMAWLIAHGDCIASPDHILAFHELVEARHKGQPIAYLTGHKEFWSLDLDVNSDVLVPRADTETLVECALSALTKLDKPQVLDLGTGSGAIALSIAKERPDASVTAVDVSSKALAVARRNAAKHNIHNVRCVQSNWFEGLVGQSFNLIAANPPYIAPGDEHLSQGDLRFEPEIALSAAHNGFQDLQTIIRSAPNFLEANGVLVVEHGQAQAEQVASTFRDNGFSSIELHFDINQLPRCTLGYLT